jgi:hypothetical protein
MGLRTMAKSFWETLDAMVLTPLAEVLGPDARAIVSALGRHADEDPEAAAKSAEKRRDDARSSRRGKGRPPVEEEERRPFIVGKYAYEHGPEATQKRWPKLKLSTIDQYRSQYEAHIKNRSI